MKSLTFILVEWKRKKSYFLPSLVSGGLSYEANSPGFRRNSLPARALKPFYNEGPELFYKRLFKAQSRQEGTGGPHTAASIAEGEQVGSMVGPVTH